MKLLLARTLDRFMNDLRSLYLLGLLLRLVANVAVGNNGERIYARLNLIF
jgi:hypothetical protein